MAAADGTTQEERESASTCAAESVRLKMRMSLRSPVKSSAKSLFPCHPIATRMGLEVERLGLDVEPARLPFTYTASVVLSYVAAI